MAAKEFKKRYTISLRKHTGNYTVSLPRAEDPKALADGIATIGKEPQSLKYHMEESHSQLEAFTPGYDVSKK